MQIKNNSMEFTNKENNQLKQLKDMVRLQKLQTKCEELKKEFENLITERSECFNKRESLMKRLTSLQEDLNAARIEELTWQRKLETDIMFTADNKIDYLKSVCALLGYQISKYQLLENNGIEVTLSYRDVCYVTYSETGQIFNLIDISPHHLNLPKIQQFLKNSQDFKGLLTCVRKFFDITLCLKEKGEKN